MEAYIEDRHVISLIIEENSMQQARTATSKPRAIALAVALSIHKRVGGVRATLLGRCCDIRPSNSGHACINE